LLKKVMQHISGWSKVCDVKALWNVFNKLLEVGRMSYIVPKTPLWQFLEFAKGLLLIAKVIYSD